VVLTLREWDDVAGVWGPPRDLSSEGTAFGAVNDPEVFGTLANGESNPFDGGLLIDQTFGEALLNVTQTFGENNCRTFVSAYVKGRSSTPFTAALKDFIAPVEVSINTCRTVNLPNMATADATNPGQDPVSDTGYINVTNDVAVDSFTDDVTAFSDVNGDGVPDLATLLDQAGVAPAIEMFSGASGNALSTLSYLDPLFRGLAVDQVADANGDGAANDPAVALLAVNTANNNITVQTRLLSSGNPVGPDITFFNALWRPLDIVVVNDPNYDGSSNDAAIGVLAMNPSTGQTGIQVRLVSDGSLVATHYYLNPMWAPLAAAVVERPNRSPLIGVLATNKDNDKIVIQSRYLVNGALDRNIYPFNSIWNAMDLASVTDANNNGNANDPAWVVLATNPTNDKNMIQSRLVANGAELKSFAVFNDTWQANRLANSADVSGNLREEVDALGRNRMSRIPGVQIRDYDTETVTENVFP